MNPDIRLRAARDDDLPALLALNESELPHVNSAPLSLFEQFATEAAYFGVACADGQPVGTRETNGGAKAMQLLVKLLADRKR